MTELLSLCSSNYWEVLGYFQDFEEEELESSKAAKADIIPSSAILRQLAVAIE